MRLNKALSDRNMTASGCESRSDGLDSNVGSTPICLFALQHNLLNEFAFRGERLSGDQSSFGMINN